MILNAGSIISTGKAESMLVQKERSMMAKMTRASADTVLTSSGKDIFE
jgi:hypothetical protein